MSSNSCADLLNRNTLCNEDFERQIRSRFLQLSARYLGADLSDSKVQFLCFSDTATGVSPTSSKHQQLHLNREL